MAEIPELSEAEWGELVERLTLYADSKLRTLWWQGETYTKDASVPGGVSAEDLAASAIESFLDESRIWDKNSEPDFQGFLKSVIDSKVSHLVNSAENKISRRLNTTRRENEPAFQVAATSRKPEAVAAEHDSLEKLKQALIGELEKDDMAKSILECFDANITKPCEIADVLEVDISEVNNAQKRLRRVAKKACDKLGRPIR